MTLIHLDDVDAIRIDRRIIDCDDGEIIRQSSDRGTWLDIRLEDLFSVGGRDDE